MPALTLRPAPLPWVAALRALPAVAVAVVGGAWLALALGVAFGVHLGSGAAVWIGIAGACACVSGWMVGGDGNLAVAVVLAVAAVGAVVVAVDTDSNPAPAGRETVLADIAPPPRVGAEGDARSGAAGETRSGAGAASVVAARKLVHSYYAAIDAGDFAAAWARLSPAVQAGFGGFAVWRSGYETTLDQRVEDVQMDGAQVRHVLVARDRRPCGGTVEQRFAVVWTLVEGRAASLHAVRLAGQDPAAAC